MTTEPKAVVEVLKCAACGKLAVSVNDLRLTAHKCAGMWTVVLTEKVSAASVRRAMRGKAVT